MQQASSDTVATAPALSGAAPFAEFFIPAATSLQERRSHTLKHGDTFGLFDQHGDALSAPGGADGLYHLDTRYLSHLCLTIDGARPILLSSAPRGHNASLAWDLTNPDLRDAEGRLLLEHDRVHIGRKRFIWNGACQERLAVRNFDSAPHRLRLVITFAADFVDLFEVRGIGRARRGTQHPAEVRADHVTLAYTGLDGRRRATLLTFDPPPDRLTAELASFDLDLAPGQLCLLFLDIRCDASVAERPVRRAFFIAWRDARRALRAASSRAPAVATSNEIFNESLRRSVSDLHMLLTETPEGPYPYAGIPWFSTVFGRDALITALETLWFDPTIARGVLGHLAANQATSRDPAADAEPGKILHEVRRGEMAELGEVPFRRYYGTIDATPLFVLLAGAYLERTGDLDGVREIWPNIEAALSWIDADGDRDGDGFVEYGRRSGEGLVNQGWKDATDSVFHEDGSFALQPIALAEVQAYVYGAWQAAATIARRLDQPQRASDLLERAAALRRRFDEAFFDEALGTYVLALDGHKRPCRVRTSNAGHALLTGIAHRERAASVVATLMDGSSFSGWGIRTVASGEARYNPMSYHNGSVWPHDNALIAAGFARYGFRREAARIFEGLFAASTYTDLGRLPELFCGFRRQRGTGPTLYPVACSPQAWAAAAPLALIQHCLGLGFDVEAGRIIFDRPVMPRFLDEIVLRRLSVGDGSVDVALRRVDTEVVVNVLSRSGDVRVVTTS